MWGVDISKLSYYRCKVKWNLKVKHKINSSHLSHTRRRNVHNNFIKVNLPFAIISCVFIFLRVQPDHWIQFQKTKHCCGFVQMHSKGHLHWHVNLIRRPVQPVSGLVWLRPFKTEHLWKYLTHFFTRRKLVIYQLGDSMDFWTNTQYNLYCLSFLSIWIVLMHSSTSPFSRMNCILQILSQVGISL